MIAWDQRVVHHIMRPSSHMNMRIFKMRIRMGTGTLEICRCYDPLEVAFCKFQVPISDRKYAVDGPCLDFTQSSFRG